MSARVVASGLALAATAAWGLWVVGHARTKSDYVRSRAASAHFARECEWMPLKAPPVSNLGFSIDDTLGWSDRATAYLAVASPSMRRGGWLDLDVAAVAAHEVVVEIESGRRYALRPGRVRLEIPPRPAAGPLLLTFHAEAPKPPAGEERRWLGLAVSRLRLCGR